MRALGIVDGASGAPRALEARLAGRARVVIASAVDGEPAVASARRAAAAYPAELLAGLAAAAAAVGAERAVVAVEERARELSFPEQVRVPDLAGCGAEADLATDVAGRADGVLVLDAQALIALGARAPVTARVVTVAGAVARPGVGLVPVGTSIEDLVEAAGGATCGPAWVALGDGPLAGRPLDRDDVVTKATRAIFVGAAGSDLIRRVRLPLSESLRRSLSACERCGMCADVCPPRLLGGRLRPDELVRALGGDARGELTAALECTACGLCDVACPSGLSPRALVTAAARALGGTAPAPAAPRADRAARRLGVGLVARRLGLGDAALDPPWAHWAFAPAPVAIPLKQSLGAAARPVVAVGAGVRRGAPIALPPDGADGVAMHASIDGVVTEIAEGAIWIKPMIASPRPRGGAFPPTKNVSGPGTAGRSRLSPGAP